MRIPLERKVQVESDGVTYKGTYVVEKGIIRVSSGFGFKKTQLGSMPADTLAKMLLLEIVREERVDSERSD